MTILAISDSKAIDLYNGAPNLLNAKVKDVIYDKTSDDKCSTTLVLTDENGWTHRITIEAR